LKLKKIIQADCYGKMQRITKQPMTMRLVQSISSNNMAKVINNYLKKSQLIIFTTICLLQQTTIAFSSYKVS
jgi:hypothetical protein